MFLSSHKHFLRWNGLAGFILVLGAVGTVAAYSREILVALESWIGLEAAIGVLILLNGFMALGLIVFCVASYRQRIARRSSLYGALAFFSGLGLFVQLALLWSWVANSRDVYASETAIRNYDNASVTSDGAGHLSVTGTIGQRLLQDISEFDIAGNPIRSIAIASDGGLILGALEVAEFVEARRLRVIVNDYCLSACVLIAVASPSAEADEDAIFGIHSASLLPNVETEMSQAWVSQSDEEVRTFLLAHHVPAKRVEESANFKGDDILYLTPAELVEAGAIKYLTSNNVIIATSRWSR